MFEDKELDRLMEEKPLTEKLNNTEDNSAEKIEQSSNEMVSVDEKSSQIISATIYNNDFKSAVGDTQRKIIEKAKEKINDEKMIEKHSENIKKITDKALEVEAEQQNLVIEEVNADNKVKAQAIKNRLIVLKAEAKRLKREEKQKSKEQKAEYTKRNKEAKWELYKDKLTRMKYDYVPNAFVLSMLLFFDGIVGFFNGVGASSTALVKALKWVLLALVVIIVLMAIPVTREWLLSILQFK